MVKGIWDKFEEYILISSFAFVIPLLLIQIIMRYVFSNSISWSEELARYIFLWQIWLGASYGVKNSKHIRIEIIKDKVSEKNSLMIEMVVIIICIGFCLFLFTKGSQLVMDIASLGQKSAAMRMPMYIAYLSVPTGSILMIIRYIERFVKTMKQMKQMEGESY